jgi:Tol biopolymer transport system component
VAVLLTAACMATVFITGHGSGPNESAQARRHPTRPAAMRLNLHVRNGPISVFGFLGGVRELSKRGLGSFDVRCGGQCSQVTGASWSADGTRLVYSTACAGSCASMGMPSHGIHVLDVKSGNDRRIVHVDSFGALSVTADGSLIVYSDGRHLNVVPADGSLAPTTIATGPPHHWFAGNPTWSPNGAWIAYDANGRIYTIAKDGSNKVILAHGYSPAWSPNGRWIAYTRDRDIRLIAPDGTHDHLLARAGLATCGRQCVWDGEEWSPDGHELAVIVHNSTRGHNSIVVVSLRTGSVRPLADLSDGTFGLTWRSRLRSGR